MGLDQKLCLEASLKGRRGPRLCGAWRGGRADGQCRCSLAGGLPSRASLARAGTGSILTLWEAPNAPSFPLGGLENHPLGHREGSGACEEEGILSSYP